MKQKSLRFITLTLALVLLLSACSNSQNSANSGVDGSGESKTAESSKITIEQVNEFLNTSAGLGADGIGNAVAVIPHAHIDGPKNETDFYAFVNWKYRARDYVKYQVTYLSCTCREASVNMWQTMYIELSLPDSKNIEDTKVKYISFDNDSTGNYIGGHWGDSSPIPSGQTYELFKEEFIPYFIKKDAKFLKTLSIINDIDLSDYQTGEGRESFEIDTFSGASVSANNIIRIINATMDYHGTDEFFNK